MALSVPIRSRVALCRIKVVQKDQGPIILRVQKDSVLVRHLAGHKGIDARKPRTERIALGFFEDALVIRRNGQAHTQRFEHLEAALFDTQVTFHQVLSDLLEPVSSSWTWAQWWNW